jgi:hypothetical protein
LYFYSQAYNPCILSPLSQLPIRNYSVLIVHTSLFLALVRDRKLIFPPGTISLNMRLAPDLRATGLATPVAQLPFE